MKLTKKPPKRLSQFNSGKGLGASRRLYDAFVPPATEARFDDPALAAVYAADVSGSSAPVEALLKSSQELTDYGRYIVDDYYTRQRQPTKKSTPAYSWSGLDWRLAAATAEFRAWRQRGLPVAAALEKAARQNKVRITTLEKHLRGDRSHSDVMKRRWRGGAPKPI